MVNVGGLGILSLERLCRNANLPWPLFFKEG
jgi:hypothetical protein